MKITDVRIGNLVYGQNANYFPIDETDFEGGDDGRIASYRPIKLTEEWLIGFGFTSKSYSEKHEDFNRWNKDKDCSIDFQYIGIENDDILFQYRIHERMRRKSIKYVHELQNLFYALTKDELVLAVTPK